MVCRDLCEAKYWHNIFNQVSDGTINSWDYQWVYTCWQQGGMSIVPNVNLVSNIGFRKDATHTSSQQSHLANRAIGSIGNISHPEFVVNDVEADKYSFDNVFDGEKMRFEATRIGRFIRLLKNLKMAIFSKFVNGIDTAL